MFVPYRDVCVPDRIDHHSGMSKIFGTVFWSPLDLFMAITDGGNGSSGLRATAFFLSLGFELSVRGYSF